MWAIVLFFVSLALLIAFAALKAWEERRGVRFLEPMRASLDARLPGIYHAAVMGNLPTGWRHTVAVFAHDATHRGVVFLVETLRAVERPLTRISFRMRIQRPSANGKGISPFLKSIIPGKKEPSDGTTPPSGV